jgi:hypothetical protein
MRDTELEKKLVGLLKKEMLIAKARSIGAKEAYEKHALYVARAECKFRHGDKVSIQYSTGPQVAVVDDVEWSWYHIRDYEGPALFGWPLLKSGKPSKVRRALCTIRMVEAGYVQAC